VVPQSLPHLDAHYYRSKIDLGSYAVYELINADVTNNVWSIAILDIHDSPRHYHKIGREIFSVVYGELDIEIDGKHQVLGVGESITVYPGTVHKLTSTSNEPVRVICFNAPAFTPTDMYHVD
jgi:mannose-6-phosphate isomerase-like protein (cupin superfamily)